MSTSTSFPTRRGGVPRASLAERIDAGQCPFVGLAGHPPADADPAGLAELAQAMAQRVRELPSPLGAVAPLVPARWLPTQGLGSTRFVGRLPEM